MAGEKIYTGEMIAALQDKIDSLITSQASVVTALGNQLTELGNVKTAVSQGVSLLAVYASDTVRKAVISSPIVKTSTFTFLDQLINLKFYCKGTIRFNVTGSITLSSTASRTISLEYTKDGGTTWLALLTCNNPPAVAGTYALTGTGNLAISENDVVAFRWKLTASTNVTGVTLSTCDLCYDLLDMVNDGAFVTV